MKMNLLVICKISLSILIAIFSPAYGQQDSKSEQKLTGTDSLGVLVVFTDPPGSEIDIDGISIESAPMKRELTVGNHTLKISLSDWIKEEVHFEIRLGKTTEITALLRKTMPILTPEDILKTKMKLISFEDFEKEEHEPVYIQKDWPLRMKKTSAMIGITSFMMALAVVKPDQFIPGETNSVGQIAFAGITLGMMGITVFHIFDDKHSTWEWRPIQENIEFNKKKKAEIDAYNSKAKNYNTETIPKMIMELEWKKKEIFEFNTGRGIHIEFH